MKKQISQMSWLGVEDVDWTSCYFVELFPSIFRLDGSFSSMNRAQKLVWTIVRIIQESIDIYLHACFFSSFFWGWFTTCCFCSAAFVSSWLAYCTPKSQHCQQCRNHLLLHSNFGRSFLWRSFELAVGGSRNKTCMENLSILPVYIYIHMWI